MARYRTRIRFWTGLAMNLEPPQFQPDYEFREPEQDNCDAQEMCKISCCRMFLGNSLMITAARHFYVARATSIYSNDSTFLIFIAFCTLSNLTSNIVNPFLRQKSCIFLACLNQYFSFNVFGSFQHDFELLVIVLVILVFLTPYLVL